MTSHKADQFEADVWAGLNEVAAEQSELQRAAEPVNRFRDLIIAALGTGRAHVGSADTGGLPAADQKKWGWAPEGYEWRARGECIGWITAQGELYLEPDVSYAVTSRIGPISVSAETLSARMADAAVTVGEREGKRRRHRPKRQAGGVRRRVLHIRSLDWLYPQERGASGATTEKDEVSHDVGAVPL